MALLKSNWLHGLHEGHEGGLHLYENKPSWIVFTEEIGHNPEDRGGKDYTTWSSQGFWPIVRLNNGYGSTGTIPEPSKYSDFARRCANYINSSKGCFYWIIGNEPNISQERPDGKPISVEEYVKCYSLCYSEIKSSPGNRGMVIMPAPLAPWNVETGDWLDYFQRMLRLLEGKVDGIALHTYTHGSSPALIISETKMDPPFQDRRFEFRAYKDFMERIPHSMRGMPVLITEATQVDPANQGWADTQNRWILAAHEEIEQWNKTEGTQKIQALICYRFPKHDVWHIDGKAQVQEDFRSAVKRGFLSPQPVVPKDKFPTVGTPPAAPATKPGAGSRELLQVDKKDLLISISKFLSIEPAVIQAVLNIESGGSGFSNGRLKIRFENHMFVHWAFQLQDPNRERISTLFKFGDPRWEKHLWRKDPSSPWKDTHGSGQASEWEAFEFARSLSSRVALMSISMGSGQIMGSNFSMLGYGSPEEMFEFFGDPVTGDFHQLVGIFYYAMSSPGLVKAMVQKDWLKIATSYNGAGRAEFYANLLRREYEKLSS